MTSNGNGHVPSIELRKNKEHITDTLSTMIHNALHLTGAGGEGHVGSKRPCKGTVNLNIHEVPTQCPERTMIDNFDEPPNSSRGRDALDVVITYSRHTS